MEAIKLWRRSRRHQTMLFCWCTFPVARPSSLRGPIVFGTWSGLGAGLLFEKPHLGVARLEDHAAWVLLRELLKAKHLALEAKTVLEGPLAVVT